MRKLTGFAVAGIVCLLASTLASATPIVGGTVFLDASSTTNPVQIFEINTDGFDNLTLAFSAIGGGTIDPCNNWGIRDCLAVGADDLTIVAGLSITNDWQYFGPFSLNVTDSSVDLIFSARITGADESMTIEWEMSGDEIHLSRVLEVPEPGTIALLSLGLIGFGMTRRRSA